MIEEEQPNHVEKRNRVFEALVDFIKLLKEREMNRPPCDCPDCQDR